MINLKKKIGLFNSNNTLFSYYNCPLLLRKLGVPCFVPPLAKQVGGGQANKMACWFGTEANNANEAATKPAESYSFEEWHSRIKADAAKKRRLQNMIRRLTRFIASRNSRNNKIFHFIKDLLQPAPTSLGQRVVNLNLKKINTSPNCFASTAKKRYGILLKYNNIIEYKFLKSNKELPRLISLTSAATYPSEAAAASAAAAAKQLQLQGQQLAFVRMLCSPVVALVPQRSRGEPAAAAAAAAVKQLQLQLQGQPIGKAAGLPFDSDYSLYAAAQNRWLPQQKFPSSPSEPPLLAPAKQGQANQLGTAAAVVASPASLGTACEATPNEVAIANRLPAKRSCSEAAAVPSEAGEDCFASKGLALWQQQSQSQSHSQQKFANKLVANQYNLIAPAAASLQLQVGQGKIMAHGRNIEETYKLLLYFFKSLNCLIGKPVILFTPDKVTIQLLYFLNIPKKKIYKFFAIYYISLIRKNWIKKMIEKKKQKIDLLAKHKKKIYFFGLPSAAKGLAEAAPTSLGQPQQSQNNIRLPKLKFKIRKSMSSFKRKPYFLRKLFFKLRRNNISKVFSKKFKIISNILSNKYNKPVEFQLIRTHYPIYDSNILINLLDLNIKNKKKKSKIAIKKIYSSLRGKNAIKVLNDDASRLKKQKRPVFSQAKPQKALTNPSCFTTRVVPAAARELAVAVQQLVGLSLANPFGSEAPFGATREEAIAAAGAKKGKQPFASLGRSCFAAVPEGEANHPVSAGCEPILAVSQQGLAKQQRHTIAPSKSKERFAGAASHKFVATQLVEIPAFLSGLNIKIAGRLMKEPILPRRTTKKKIKGATATGKVNFLDIATIKNKNKKGAYTITIKSGHNFF